jgi:hypothetical protein
MTQSAQIMYENFIELSAKNDECPLCERAFEKAEEMKEFIRSVSVAFVLPDF